MTDWSRFKADQGSYELTFPGAKNSRADLVIVKCPVHGHVALSSGQVFQGECLDEKGLKVSQQGTLE